MIKQFFWAAFAIPCFLVLGAMDSPSSESPGNSGSGTVGPPENLASALEEIYGDEARKGNLYVGSDYCLTCHIEYSGWKNTKHAQTIRRPLRQFSMVVGKGVTADHDQDGLDDFVQGLDFNQISSCWDPWKPNAPKLQFKNGNYTIILGDVELPVVLVNGGTGEWRERYVVRVPVSDSPSGYTQEVYFSPVQFNASTKGYVPYKADLWYTPDKKPLIRRGMTGAEVGAVLKASFSKNCIGCHTTGIRWLGKTPQGEWGYRPYIATFFSKEDPYYLDYDGDARMDLLGVGCEACHGPGQRHVLEGGDPSQIVNPRKLESQKGNEVCGRCHNRVRSVPNKIWAWPYKETDKEQWLPGSAPLSEFYANANEMWPDSETSYEHNQHYSELNRSSHVIKAGMRCFDCHDPHSRGNHSQIRTQISVGGRLVSVRDEDNSLCLACHAGKEPFGVLSRAAVGEKRAQSDKVALAVGSHSHHPYGPDRTMGLSRCSRCHMAPLANTERESVHRSHTFAVVPPEKTLKYADQAKGMVNSCAAACHGNLVNSFGLGLDPNRTAWSEPFDLKTASVLLMYYGPDGLWWRTRHK